MDKILTSLSYGYNGNVNLFMNITEDTCVEFKVESKFDLATHLLLSLGKVNFHFFFWFFFGNCY